MPIIILIFATLLLILWLILFYRANAEDMIDIAYAQIADKRMAVLKLQAKEKVRGAKLCAYGEGALYGKAALVLVKLFSGKGKKREIAKINKEIDSLQSGMYKHINPFLLPGYVLQREMGRIAKSGIRKTLLSKCFELYGKKSAPIKTKQLLAKMLSYPMIGISVTFIIGAMLMISGNITLGLTVIGVGSALILIVAYAIYDEQNELVKKRHASICKQFPSVVSKLALLVTSGMIMDRAWKETAYSAESVLYTEMRKTSKELDNLVSPESAFGNFINRCNTKETAKLAAAIMQNLSKGNAEIGRLLRDMAREAWQERRHSAKRDAEKANSKLMIPTMLLFLAILVMLMVPIAMNFSGI
ncbi:MAG: type II secretion system F family protein [Oscillospiraceae bacterium]|nr:type II secretion system F family protein [Oscillospiraceae bacterium]